MALNICSINSGSNGNCYYVGNEHESVLIDAGISCRTIVSRMKLQGLDIATVKAVFISHEHSDHIKGVEVLSKKFRIPVYITARTLANSSLQLIPDLVSDFSDGDIIKIGKLEVHAFSKVHDAADPHSFCIMDDEVKVGVFTDIGCFTNNFVHWFAQCNAAFLESNYDQQMLMNGNYPYFLKNRISGGDGHLSNHHALELFTQHRNQQLSHLILSHLSAHNNHPDIVQQLFEPHAGNVQVTVAPRHQATEVFRIRNHS